MFGLGWEQIILILLAALVLLGPERIPGAVRWVMESLRKVRTMATGAQDQLRNEMGGELEDLRNQIRELQSLKEIDELRQLRKLNPRKLLGDTLLGEEFSGGVTGFLGLNDPPPTTPGKAPPTRYDTGAPLPSAQPAGVQAAVNQAVVANETAGAQPSGAEPLGAQPAAQPVAAHEALGSQPDTQASQSAPTEPPMYFDDEGT